MEQNFEFEHHLEHVFCYLGINLEMPQVLFICGPRKQVQTPPSPLLFFSSYSSLFSQPLSPSLNFHQVYHRFYKLIFIFL